MARLHSGSRQELAPVFVSFLLAIYLNSSRLIVYTGVPVDLQFLANGYIHVGKQSNMTKTFSAKTTGVNCCLKNYWQLKLFA